MLLNFILLVSAGVLLPVQCLLSDFKLRLCVLVLCEVLLSVFNLLQSYFLKNAVILMPPQVDYFTLMIE
jgi:hypothetical protein